MNDWFFQADFGAAPTNFFALTAALLLAFVCGQAIAWTYMVTHQGLSYSRSYVRTLILIPIIVTLVMMILANNLVVAFGLMAIFAMVRFRSILRDTLDTAYVLAVIVIGLGCGTGKFSSALLGCLATVGLMAYFRLSSFGTRHRYDIILNLHWLRPSTELSDLTQLLSRHSRRIQLASQHAAETGEGLMLSYRLLLRDPGRTQDLMDEVNACAGVTRASSLQTADESEV